MREAERESDWDSGRALSDVREAEGESDWGIHSEAIISFLLEKSDVGDYLVLLFLYQPKQVGTI